MNNIFDFSKILLLLTQKTEALYQSAAAYVESMPNNKLLAVTMFLTSIILFFILIFVWYLKSIANKIREQNRREQEIMQGIDTRLDRKIPDNFDELNAESEEVAKSKDIDAEKAFDFDWNREMRFSATDKIRSGEAFQYRFKPQKLEQLFGLIVDLLERGVDEPKISQTIMHKNQHLNSEDEVIQTITAIKFFIYMCLSGRFKKIDTDKILPQENAAIFHIAKGDCSLALVLLEALIDNNIAKIKGISDNEEKERKWCETSNCATIFGTLASFTNKDLAAAAFELAIELNPRNVTAWGRIGDMYTQKERFDDAVWAYSNVLNLADEEIYTQQIANANKMLAVLYTEKGQRQKADILAQKSRQYYDNIGINTPLTERENKIVYIIESTENDKMEEIVDKLFTKTDNQTLGYV